MVTLFQASIYVVALPSGAEQRGQSTSLETLVVSTEPQSAYSLEQLDDGIDIVGVISSSPAWEVAPSLSGVTGVHLQYSSLKYFPDFSVLLWSFPVFCLQQAVSSRGFELEEVSLPVRCMVLLDEEPSSAVVHSEATAVRETDVTTPFPVPNKGNLTTTWTYFPPLSSSSWTAVWNFSRIEVNEPFVMGVQANALPNTLVHGPGMVHQLFPSLEESAMTGLYLDAIFGSDRQLAVRFVVCEFRKGCSGDEMTVETNETDIAFLITSEVRSRSGGVALSVS